MFYKDFKGNQISALGLGGMRLPSVPGKPDQIDREAGQEVIDRAIRLGVNYFDTAHIYPKNGR